MKYNFCTKNFAKYIIDTQPAGYIQVISKTDIKVSSLFFAFFQFYTAKETQFGFKKFTAIYK